MAIVKVTVDQINVANPTRGRVPLVAYKDEQVSVHEAVRAWAQFHEFASFIGAVDRCFEEEPPASGYSITIDRPDRLMMIAVWPWAPAKMHGAH